MLFKNTQIQYLQKIQSLQNMNYGNYTGYQIFIYFLKFHFLKNRRFVCFSCMLVFVGVFWIINRDFEYRIRIRCI